MLEQKHEDTDRFRAAVYLSDTKTVAELLLVRSQQTLTDNESVATIFPRVSNIVFSHLTSEALEESANLLRNVEPHLGTQRRRCCSSP